MTIDIEYKDPIDVEFFNRSIKDRKTFYIYKFNEFEPKIKLFIVDGIKTNPPLSITIDIIDHDNYEKVFTIPKGIIHTYHSDWINEKTNQKLYLNNLICNERNDDLAISEYIKYLKNVKTQLKLENKGYSHKIYKLNKILKSLDQLTKSS